MLSPIGLASTPTKELHADVVRKFNLGYRSRRLAVTSVATDLQQRKLQGPTVTQPSNSLGSSQMKYSVQSLLNYYTGEVPLPVVGIMCILSSRTKNWLVAIAQEFLAAQRQLHTFLRLLLREISMGTSWTLEVEALDLLVSPCHFDILQLSLQNMPLRQIGYRARICVSMTGLNISADGGSSPSSSTSSSPSKFMAISGVQPNGMTDGK